ncbi:MAG: hypothetical protein WCO57_16375 [Verrucomicrobiota bacterium]
MITRNFLSILIAWCLPVVGYAQQNEVAGPVPIRAVLHDPVHPDAELYLTDKAGGMARLKLVREGFSVAQITIPVNGALVLYNSSAVDPKQPMANLAASAKLPPHIKRAMLIILPKPSASKAEDPRPAYQMVVIDDSAEAFPSGESRVLPLVTVETAIQAGEHRLAVHPGGITNVPPVRKVNPYNMAQTNFYYKEGDSWVPFTERQLQYLDTYRRVFIIHVTPGALQPVVTTLVDIAPAELPQ